MKEFKHLSYASSLCGKCSEVCPVKIDIHKMLLLNRRDAVDQHENTRAEDIGWKVWNTGMSKRSMMDMFGGKVKNFLLKFLFKKMWGKYRVMPEIADKSFAKQWQEKNKNKPQI